MSVGFEPWTCLLCELESANVCHGLNLSWDSDSKFKSHFKRGSSIVCEAISDIIHIFRANQWDLCDSQRIICLRKQFEKPAALIAGGIVWATAEGTDFLFPCFFSLFVLCVCVRVHACAHGFLGLFPTGEFTYHLYAWNCQTMELPTPSLHR